LKRGRIIRTGQKLTLRAALPWLAVIVVLLLVALNLWLGQQNAMLAKTINLLDQVASSRVATLDLLRDKYTGQEHIAYERIWELDDGAWAMLKLTVGNNRNFDALARLQDDLAPARNYTSAHGLKATRVVEMVNDGQRIWALHGADGNVGLGISRYDAANDGFVPMGASSGLASENVSRLVPARGRTFALYAEPAMGIGVYDPAADRWNSWEPLSANVADDVIALEFIEDKFFVLTGPSGGTAEISGLCVLAPDGRLLANLDLAEGAAESTPRLVHFGLTRRGMFIELEATNAEGLATKSTQRIDLNTLEMEQFSIDGTAEAFAPVSTLPFYNWGNIALFIGEDGSVAALDEHTGDFELLDGLSVYEDISNIWHHQGELWVSSHHARGLLPGQWKLCRYDTDRHSSEEFGLTPGFFGTVLQSGGGVRVNDVASRGQEMWLALDRGLYKRVRRDASEASEWYALLKKDQRPVKATELQFLGERLLVRTLSGWQNLQLESETGNHLIACADPFKAEKKL